VGDSIERTLGRIEAKLDAVLVEQALEPARRKEVYERLNSLERWRSGIVAAGTAVAAMFGIILRLGGK
jgi:anti-sigma-K factor RskA